MYHLVDVVHSNDQSFEDMGTLLRFLQVVLGTTDGHVMTVLHEVLHAFLQGKQTGTSLYQSNAVHGEGALQGRHLEQLVQNHVGVGILLHVDDDTHTLTTRLVVGVRDTLELTFLHQVGDILNELCFVHAIRNLSDDNLVMSLMTLDFGLGTHHDSSPTRFIGIFHALQTVDISTCGEVGSLDILHQAFGINIRIVDIGTAPVDDLTQVMCRDIGSHTYCNTVTTVHQQVRNLRRHHARLRQ